jgi:L,D-transpeptidase catalytic domain
MSLGLRAMHLPEKSAMVIQHESEPMRRHLIESLLRSFVAVLALAVGGCAQTVTGTVPSGGPKRVVVDKTTQELTAYEGDKVVLRTRVSTGRMGRRTPSGKYTAGVKWRIHYSRLYDNAPMPYSVHVNGNYFIHGFSSVPDRPASHGCIRVPLTGDNPAKRFYEWVETGTPIEITGEWTPPPRPPKPVRPKSATAESLKPKKPGETTTAQ